jgi:chemotaxis signal transduction protein
MKGTADMDGYIPDNGKGSAFDWESVRGRIAAANAALEGLDETSPEVMQEIWARRAAKWAEVPVEEDEGDRVDLVLARLGREVYGLDAQYVSVIRPVEQITPVPRVPDWVAGVVNVRGRILSVIDLRCFFGLSRAPGPLAQGQRATPRGLPSAVGNGQGSTGGDSDDSIGFSYELDEGVPSLVVVETPDMEVALLTQDVLNIEAMPESRIEDAAGTVRGLRPEYVRGVAEHNEGGISMAGGGSMVVVLDLPALLADGRLIIHEEIA